MFTDFFFFLKEEKPQNRMRISSSLGEHVLLDSFSLIPTLSTEMRKGEYCLFKVSP